MLRRFCVKQIESEVIDAEFYIDSGEPNGDKPKGEPDLEIIPLETIIMDTLCMKSYDNLHKEI